MDTHTGKPAACPRRAPAGSGTARPGREDLVEVVGGRDLELIVATVGRLFVRAPAQERRHVTKAAALQMIVLHLTHALDPQRLPREVLARAPAALSARHTRVPCRIRIRPCTPRMVL